MFEKGHKKIGGRTNGTPNKCTARQNQLITDFLSSHFGEFENEIWPSLEAKDKKDTIIAMLNYVYPKLQSVDVNAQVQKNESALEAMRGVVNDSDII